MEIKIAITGAMGVGKTTLSHDLQKALGHTRLPEVARMMIDKGHIMDKNVSIATELEMLGFQKELEQTKGSWIADRCIIDILAYAYVIFPYNDRLHNEIRETLGQAEYDVIIYLPPEFPIEDDGVRSTDSKFRDKVDVAIKKILRKMPHHEITGSPELRLEKVTNIIKSIV